MAEKIRVDMVKTDQELKYWLERRRKKKWKLIYSFPEDNTDPNIEKIDVFTLTGKKSKKETAEKSNTADMRILIWQKEES